MASCQRNFEVGFTSRSEYQIQLTISSYFPKIDIVLMNSRVTDFQVLFPPQRRYRINLILWFLIWRIVEFGKNVSKLTGRSNTCGIEWEFPNIDFFFNKMKNIKLEWKCHLYVRQSLEKFNFLEKRKKIIFWNIAEQNNTKIVSWWPCFRIIIICIFLLMLSPFCIPMINNFRVST